MRAGLGIWLGFAAGGLLAAALGCGPEFLPATTGNGGAGGGGGPSGPGGAGGAGGSGGTGGAMCSTEDADGDTFSECTGDCDDADPTIPASAEICGDGIDNDCDGEADPQSHCKGLGTFVSADGDDMQPGTMDAPVRTIAKGIANALQIAAPGTAVYVAEGSYAEDVVLAPDVLVLGGHDPATWARDPEVHTSLIACTSFACVRADETVGRSAVLDGFEIQGLGGTPTTAPGSVVVQIDGGSPTISNNRIVGGSVEGALRRSVGVHVLGEPADGPLLQGNRIGGGASLADAAVGVLLDAGTRAVITGNEIAGGAGQSSYGILEEGTLSGTEITENQIRGGMSPSTTGSSFGVRCRGSVLIARNLINTDLGSSAQCDSASAWCGGIHSDSSAARIENNVIFGALARLSVAVYITEMSAAAPVIHVSSNYLDGYGSASAALTARSAAIALASPYAGGAANAAFAVIRSNVLLGGRNSGRFGVYEDTVISQTCSPAELTNNLFHFADENGTNNLYREWTGTQATNINTLGGLDVGFVDNKTGDPLVDMSFHLMDGSPCIGAGTELDAPAVDFDGEVRPQGLHDIGPDEVP